MVIFKEKTVTVYHVTKLKNVPSILKEGILASHQKERTFERDVLGLDLTQEKKVYLSKSLEHLVIPPVEGKSVVLQIDLPKNVYNRFEKENKGDPQINWFEKNKSRFGGSFGEFLKFVIQEMMKRNPNLQNKVNEDIKKYGSLEKTPQFKFSLTTAESMSPKYTIVTPDDIKPEWIRPEYLTERDLKYRGIIFGG